LKRVKSRLSGKMGRKAMSWFGGGTMRGAGAKREGRDGTGAEKSLARTSCLRVSTGGALKASTTGSGSGSPSKKREMAIWRVSGEGYTDWWAGTDLDVPLGALQDGDGLVPVLVCDGGVLLERGALVLGQAVEIDGGRHVRGRDWPRLGGGRKVKTGWMDAGTCVGV
jgi:hypothetical protein